MRFSVTVMKEAVFPVIRLADTVSGTYAEIYSAGALLNAFCIRLSGGGEHNFVDGFSSPEDCLQNITQGFRSAKLSPFVCRMHKGSYVWNDTKYQTKKWYLGEHSIHGLLYDAAFTVTDQFASNEKAAVTLEYHYSGEDKGYPFPYTMMVSWQLTDGNHLSVTTSVYHHQEQAIPFADGWHPYFTLGGPVDDCTLQFSSSRQLAYDADLLPTGNIIEDGRFRNGSSLQNITLDNSFELSFESVQPRCILENKRFRFTIEPGKAYPVLQIYTPPHRKSIAIENLSGAPDNFNNHIHLLVLEPNEQKLFRTVYSAEELT